MRSHVAAILATIATCLLAAPALPARAAGAVAPGQTLNLAPSDYGTRRCRTGGVEFNRCLQGAFVGTGWNLADRRVRALVLRPAGPRAIALPSAYAEAALHHEFDLGGVPGTFVNAQFRVEYDLDPAQIAMLGNAYGEVTVSLVVRDITHGDGFPVTAHQLYQLRRDNTQGFTDVAGAHERQVRPGETGHVQVMLLTGRRYAASFVVEVMTGAFAGGGDARGVAVLDALSVWVDEDEVALLDDLAVALERHDEDIKARLDTVDAQLRVIKRLLETPQGRRPGWNAADTGTRGAPPQAPPGDALAVRVGYALAGPYAPVVRAWRALWSAPRRIPLPVE